MRASRGNYTILFVGALVMLMAGGALAVDLGRYRLAWQEATAAAEAAAMGGALTLRAGDALPTRRVQAVTRAQELLEANLGRVVVDVDAGAPVVEVGIWDAQTRSFTISEDAGAALRISIDHEGIAATFARALGGGDQSMRIQHAVIVELTPRDVVVVSDLSLGTPLDAIEALRDQLSDWLTRTAELGVPEDTLAVVGAAGVTSGSDALRSLATEPVAAAGDVDLIQPCVVPVDSWLNYYRFHDYSSGAGELDGAAGVEIRPLNPANAMTNPKLKWSYLPIWSADPGALYFMAHTGLLRFSGATWPFSLPSASLVDEEICAAYLSSWDVFQDLDPRGQRTAAWPDSWLQCDDGNLLKDTTAGVKSNLEMPGLDCSSTATSSYVHGENEPAGGYGTIGGNPGSSYPSDAAYAGAGSFLEEGIWDARDLLSVDDTAPREGVAVVFTGAIPGCGVEMADLVPAGDDTCEADEVQTRVSDALLALAAEAGTINLWVLDDDQDVVDWWTGMVAGLEVEVRTVDASAPDADLFAAFQALDAQRPVRRVR